MPDLRLNDRITIDSFRQLPLSIKMVEAATVLVEATQEYLRDQERPGPDPALYEWRAASLRDVAHKFAEAEARVRLIHTLASQIYDDLVDPLDDNNNIDRRDCEALARKLIDLGWRQQ